MRVWIFTLVVLLGGAGSGRLWSREAFVRTQHGEIYEGQVRWETNAIVLVNPNRELWVRLPLREIEELVFPGTTTEGEVEFSTPAGRGPWEELDIGSVRRSGRSERLAGTPGGFRVWGEGTNILAGSDAFHFVFRRVRGASELIAKVTPAAPAGASARAGLMVREGLAADARNVLLSISLARGEVLQWRERQAQDTSALIDPGWSAPHWLKLRRLGDRVSAFRSRNGRVWRRIGRIELAGLAEEICVGLAVVSVREMALHQAAFEGVEEGPWLPNRWFTPEIELCSTSVARGRIHSMDDALIYFDGAMPRSPLARAAVSVLRFRPLPAAARALVNSGRRGVMLASGEFVDGECRSIADGAVTLSSVPLGLCHYDLDTDVTALVLGGRGALVQVPWEVATDEGSVLIASQVELEPDGLRLREPSLGWRRLPFHEVTQLRQRH